MKPIHKVMISAAILFVTALLAVLVYFGFIHLNHPGKKRYPVRGVDVSSYQGKIDWPLLAEQKIDFAFIKATEGSDYVDDCFAANFNAAVRTELKVGAYHFFTGLSPGKTQAENYIRTVPKTENMLPPVVDVEFPSSVLEERADELRQELLDFLETVTAYYGKNPIIYVTEESCQGLIQGTFDDYNIWYRSVYRPIPKGRSCTFWQYSNRHRLKGYSGRETYIDMNTFCGGREEWETYCAGNGV